MAKAASPLFSLEARGKLAGLTISRRRSVAQVFKSLKLSAIPPSSSQLSRRYFFRTLVPLWRQHYSAPSDVYAWDRLRRYNHLPGSAFNRWLTDYLPLRFANITPFYLTAGSIDREPIAPALRIWITTDRPPGQLWCSFGPTPDYPASIAQMLQWAPNSWIATVTDAWPTQRVYARVSACIFGPTVAGLSGLFATTHNG